MAGALERAFKLSERRTDVRTEVLAGVTTFITMAYIIFVNPAILAEAGMPFGALMVSTCIAAAIGSILMALLANYPIALAPGMGLNAFFAFSVVLGMGVSWQTALTAILIEGLLFVLLTLTKLREAVMNGIPVSLKNGITMGVGLFIAFIGAQNGGLIIKNDATIVGLATLRGNIPALLSIFGLIVIGALEARRVRGAILWGILIVTAAAIPFGIAKMPEAIISAPPSISGIAWAFDFSLVSLDITRPEVANFWLVVFTFFFMDFFDTLGALVGLASGAKLLDDKGRLPRASRALMADALGTVAGAALGVSTVTSYGESAAGIGLGGRTGLTSVVTAALFLLAIFFSPIAGMIPPCATAPALIFVGIYMFMCSIELNFKDWTELLPSMAAVITIPFAYSISGGIELAVITYVFVKLLSGRAKETSPVMWLLAVVFMLKEAFL